MNFEKDDLSEQNTAPSPWYNIYNKGRVDIGIETGNMRIISLNSDGMYKLVKSWLKSAKSSLSEEEKQQMKDKLK